jgi:preprotein translocase subunit YajC
MIDPTLALVVGPGVSVGSLATAPPIAGGNGGGGGQPVQGADGSPAGGGGPAGPPPGGFGGGGLLLFMILLFVGLIVMQALAGRKEKKRRQEMLDALGKHDRVQTVGGIIGTVTEVRENEILLKVDENTNTKLRMTRASVQQVLKSASSGATAEVAEPEKVAG